MVADILIVDDEKDIAALIAEVLSDEGYETRRAHSSDEALHAVAERVPSAIILDIWLQGSELDGLGVLEMVKEKHPNLPVIMISGHGNIETAVSAMKMGAYNYIVKPFKEDHLLVTVKHAIDAAKLRQENDELRLRAGPEADLIGNHTAVKQLRGSIERVAPTGSRVLIQGPAGAGKEVVARLIHKFSRRAAGPFVVLNAARMSPDKVETELFGIEDTGNPTGGAKKVGTLERAHGGTLLIDEVADMPMATQGKILRVLQDQSFERVGGSRRVKVDVRVLAATNHDLRAEISAGRFREDLYYRLNVVPVEVPALKERRDDIPMLCEYFLRRSADISGLPMRKLSEDAMATLQSYDWPGNVRQLRNLMEWLLIMAPGGPDIAIRADMLPPEFFASTPASVNPGLNSDIMSMPLREARELFEKQYLTAQINRFGGNISRTSSFIGMERSALHRKIKTLALHAEE
ncbi:MAG: sigma-54-dependent Fis family transcriptional regulator [Alphaproteobacteria bacterium]|nr:sigma-54-dependent Fis family transcriptional regulator [Alphaproteobacteria bacterium]